MAGMESAQARQSGPGSTTTAPSKAAAAQPGAGNSAPLMALGNRLNTAPRVQGLVAQAAGLSSGAIAQLKKKEKKGDGFKAGSPGAWHVHYDHIKFGTNNNTRVDFHNDDAATIINNLNQALTRHNILALIANNQDSYDKCIKYINKNY